jgi:hypothetical protein
MNYLRRGSELDAYPQAVSSGADETRGTNVILT